MAKNADSNKVYINELGVTINKDNYYAPEVVSQNPRAALITPCIFTAIYVMCVISGPELFLLVSVILGGFKLTQLSMESSDKQVFDAYRFAFDVITAKTLGQPEYEGNNLPVEGAIDLIGETSHAAPGG